MKLDLIVSHPKNNDYPLWRDMIKEHRYKLNKVIVVFTETNDGLDFSNFIRQVMYDDDITFLDSPMIPKNGDWRNTAVRYGLKHSKADFVWFSEQDFFIKNGFWKYVSKSVSLGADVIASYQETRMHPCNIIIRREILEKTNLDFGIVPGKLDHFGLIQKDIEQITNKIAKVPPKFYRHLNGLSHNFNLVKNGGIPNYEKRTFNMYLNQCLDADVHLSSKWVKIVIDYFDRL